MGTARPLLIRREPLCRARCTVVMSSDEEIGRLFRIRRTMAKMLHDRGYLVSQADINMTLDGFKEKYTDNPSREQLTMLHQMRDDPSTQIFVFFEEEVKVGVKPIRRNLERMKDENVHRAIIVVQQGLTSFAKQALQNTSGSRYKVEQFLEKELLVNIT